MSMTYNISCHDCEEKLWIGQRNRIYYTPEDHAAFQKFLFKHENHVLSFGNEDKNEHFKDVSDYSLLNEVGTQERI